MRRLFIIRKDLHLSSGKLAAMVGHCCEAYWTNILKLCPVKDNEFVDLPCYDPDHPDHALLYRHPAIYEKSNFFYTFTGLLANYLNQLKKAEALAKENSLVEWLDYGFINDSCLTELTPENEDGTCTIGMWFKPLPDDIAHRISKKFPLYRD